MSAPRRFVPLSLCPFVPTRSTPTPQQAESAYRSAARLVHPDKVAPELRPDATRAMRKLNAAKEALLGGGDGGDGAVFQGDEDGKLQASYNKLRDAAIRAHKYAAFLKRWGDVLDCRHELLTTLCCPRCEQRHPKVLEDYEGSGSPLHATLRVGGTRQLERRCND